LNDDEQNRWAFECATGNSDRLLSCRFAGYRVDGRTVRKQAHHVESRMEYYWELRSKNAQNINKQTESPWSTEYTTSPMRQLLHMHRAEIKTTKNNI